MEEKSSKIQDIASIDKFRREMESIEAIRKILPFFRWTKWLGLDISKIEKELEKAGDMRQQAEELAKLPDKFNELFSNLGWIAYETLNVDLMKSAISIADQGDFNRAEQVLVEHYNEKNLDFHLITMRGIKAFQPRIDLFQKAKRDYVEERYYSCTLVVLSQLDGLVTEVNQKNLGDSKGFFAKDVNLEAWDSISAHSTGLTTLAKVLGKERRKISTEPLSLPYRHGILHGHDLGYDNKMVAAKAWAALFSVRDWALKVEQGRKEFQAEKPRPGFRETIKQLVESNKESERLKSWKARTLIAGVDFPVSGLPENYPINTPERKLAEFMLYWKKKNYGRMAECLPVIVRYPINKAAGNLKLRFKNSKLVDFTIKKILDHAPAVTIIEVQCICEFDGTVKEVLTELRFINEDEEGNVGVVGKPDTNWSIFAYALVDLI
jgi:hypothetical protein